MDPRRQPRQPCSEPGRRRRWAGRRTVTPRTYVRAMTSTAPPTRPAGSRVETDLSWAADRLVGRPWASHTDEELVDRLQQKQRQRSRDVAEEAELILALAGQRPASEDPSAEHPGARRPGWTPQAAAGEVSEFFTAELATVLNLGRGTASKKLARALTWRDKLPLTFAALQAGELDERRANALADVLEHVSAEVARQVEAALLVRRPTCRCTRWRP